ncbi:hypothetical protein OIE69_44010 (plasmid) [Actinacidiphila glaucinigra]|uniref:hypothetical protein n=1 Tax=Actinacidiphila glaucinigra TaxID=235986 RepID=UPI002DDAC295|nr:hypothetical protein [Actinacidiphila glaucinigra]WSD65871.1 hypothetical protein OIE69_44010 [Actinacidiphila glaucinigra]
MKGAYFDAPDQEVHLLSSLLRTPGAARDLVQATSAGPRYWLSTEHFQTDWIANAYGVLASGGLEEIETETWRNPGQDPAITAANIVVRRLWDRHVEMAASGHQGAQAVLNDAAHWQDLLNKLIEVGGARYASVQDARHHAYVIVRGAERPSAIDGVPFSLAGRPATGLTIIEPELAVLGAILDDPQRAERFLYSPTASGASPYWLQPEDFSDPLTAEIWDALVTGPDPAIALPAVSDPLVTPAARTEAMIEHVYRRLWFNDYLRRGGDPAAQARIDSNAMLAIREVLVQASRGAWGTNPDLAPIYALDHILEPSITHVVDELAGAVRVQGTADTALYEVARALGAQVDALDKLRDRLDAGLTFRSDEGGARVRQPPPSSEVAQKVHTTHDVERRVLISLIRDPSQLRGAGATPNLAPQDFTRAEHHVLFRALQEMDPALASDPWLVAAHANRLAAREQIPGFRNEAMLQVLQDLKTRSEVPRAEVGAHHLITMTVRRSAVEASLVMTAGVQDPAVDRRQLLVRSRGLVQQATAEALRIHAQSVPAPAPQRGAQHHVA